MKRRLLNLLTAMSLVLCVAVVALWVWTYLGSVAFVVVSRQRSTSLSLRTGGIAIESWFTEKRVNPRWEWRRFGPDDSAVPLIARPATALNRLGFFYGSRSGPGYDAAGVAFPCWVPLIVFATAPALRLRRVAKARHRRRRRLCPRCGYDLRATPGRCPECGAIGAVGAAP
jgi:hypothetical protein